MKRVMVRYRVKPDQVEANEALVRAVFEELERERPGGFGYATFKLDDGVSFVHIVDERDDDEREFAGRREGVREVPRGHPRPLRRTPGRDRSCNEVGSFRFFDRSV